MCEEKSCLTWLVRFLYCLSFKERVHFCTMKKTPRQRPNKESQVSYPTSTPTNGLEISSVRTGGLTLGSTKDLPITSSTGLPIRYLTQVDKLSATPRWPICSEPGQLIRHGLFSRLSLHGVWWTSLWLRIFKGSLSRLMIMKLSMRWMWRSTIRFKFIAFSTACLTAKVNILIANPSRMLHINYASSLTKISFIFVCNSWQCHSHVFTRAYTSRIPKRTPKLFEQKVRKL